MAFPREKKPRKMTLMGCDVKDGAHQRHKKSMARDPSMFLESDTFPTTEEESISMQKPRQRKRRQSGS
ncbi:hypothetical protein Bca4012_064616 [Brassica carinata]